MIQGRGRRGEIVKGGDNEFHSFFENFSPSTLGLRAIG